MSQKEIPHEPVWTLVPPGLSEDLGVVRRHPLPKVPKFFRVETLAPNQAHALSTLRPEDREYLLRGMMRAQRNGVLTASPPLAATTTTTSTTTTTTVELFAVAQNALVCPLPCHLHCSCHVTATA